MKVWGMTDPRNLKDKHLLGEHLEIHTLISGGWENHPESLYKRFDGDIRWPIMRHEFIRIAMNQRWEGRHTKDKHKSPVDLYELDEEFSHYVTDYSISIEEFDAFSGQEFFEAFMEDIGFPKTTIGYDNPWERENLSMLEYWDMEGVRANA
jgi:hypothetical protein